MVSIKIKNIRFTKMQLLRLCRRHYAHSLALLVAMVTVGHLMAAFFAVASPTAVSPYMCAVLCMRPLRRHLACLCMLC